MRNKLYYLVAWLGYTPNDKKWEPIEIFTDAPELVEEFNQPYFNKPVANQALRRVGVVVKGGDNVININANNISGDKGIQTYNR